MTITPLQSATQLTIIQTGDARTDTGRQRPTDSGRLADLQISPNNGELQNDENTLAKAVTASNANGNQVKGKKPDFSSLSESLKNSLQLTNVLFEFSIDSQSQSIILRIVDSETKEVLQQLPSDLALKISRLIAGSLEQGQVTDAKV